MDIAKKITSIKAKLAKLKQLDQGLRIFGADSHRYALGETLSPSVLDEFQSHHQIRLPEDYRAFLLEVGNGGAGPYYGLQTLQDSLYADLDYKREGELLNPSLPFPLSEPWNMAFTGDSEDEAAYGAFEQTYFADNWTHGLLRICNFGCGVSLNLVVNGSEHGNIWVDDRGNDGGLYPDPYFEQEGRTQFLDWYELWLDRSLAESK